MKLYHGTSSALAKQALRVGLKPRILHGKSNWKHTVESNPTCVYLTTAYAGYFAHCAAKTSHLGILEIDTDLLDHSLLMPDEDFLEQGTRGVGPDKLSPFLKKMCRECGDDMKKRTLWFRRNLPAFQDLWEKSLEFLGNCSYMGTIPASAITRAATFNWKKNPRIGLGLLDPSITPINYRVMGEHYRSVTRWLIGDSITPEEYARPTPLSLLPTEYQTQLEAGLADRTGWKKLR